MKKFLGVLVALTLCVCMLAPVASAADESLLSDIFGGINVGDLTEADLNEIIADLGLEGIDVDAILGGDSDALAKLESAISGIESSIKGEEETTAAQASGSTDSTSGLDLSWLTGLLGDKMDTSAITDMLSGLGSADLDSLLGSISGAFGDAGVDLGDEDLGSDVAGEVDNSNVMAGIMDTIFGALESLGLDTSLIEGMLDNDIVNFFANMYIGFIGQVEEETTAAPETTKAPVVVTTKAPETGDTSAVFAALATLTVASAAAFVCLKKKED